MFLLFMACECSDKKWTNQQPRKCKQKLKNIGSQNKCARERENSFNGNPALIPYVLSHFYVFNCFLLCLYTIFFTQLRQTILFQPKRNPSFYSKTLTSKAPTFLSRRTTSSGSPSTFARPARWNTSRCACSTTGLSFSRGTSSTHRSSRPAPIFPISPNS